MKDVLRRTNSKKFAMKSNITNNMARLSQF